MKDLFRVPKSPFYTGSSQFYLSDQDKLKEKILNLLVLNDINIKYKTNSTLMKVFNVVAKYLTKDRFMSVFTTTVGRNIYIPSELWAKNSDVFNPVITHETCHVRQEELYISKYGSLFGRLAHRLGYIAPQIYAAPALLSLLAILAIWFGPVWLLCLNFLVFLLLLLPGICNANYRLQTEIEGYGANILFDYWMKGIEPDKYNVDWIYDSLSGPAYYWTTDMSKDSFRVAILGFVNALKDDDIALMNYNPVLFEIKQYILELRNVNNSN